MNDRTTLLARIYRLKLVATGAILVLLGLVFSVLGDWLSSRDVPHLLVAIVNASSDVFAVTGALGLAVDYITGRDKDAADAERIRHLLDEAAPAFRDAVISGFAETPESMRGVATTETLDKLATNALALRLGDDKFAAEIYEGLLAQAIKTPERWSDVDINVRLSCIQETSSVGAGRTNVSAELFDAVVVWEYTLVPSARIQRFASTDDEAEFREFLNDVPATSTWLIPDDVIDPAAREAFEVLSYSVDGDELPLRRSVRKHGQTYSVDLGEEVIAKGAPVRVRHVYRTVVPRLGHRFRVSLTQPAHGVRLVLDYTGADIAVLKVGDMVSSAIPAQVKFLPSEAPAKQVEVTAPNWLLPQTEITFVWTLSDELAAATKPPRSRAA